MPAKTFRKAGLIVLLLAAASFAAGGQPRELAPIDFTPGEYVLTGGGRAVGPEGGTDAFPGEDVMAYDDGKAAQPGWWSPVDEALGVRFTPLAYPCRVVQAQYCGYAVDSSFTAAGLWVQGDGGGHPGSCLLTQSITVATVNPGSWSNYDLSTPTDIPSGDFYLFIENLSAYSIAYFDDSSGNTARDWDWEAEDGFTSLSGVLYGAALVRAKVQYHDVGAVGTSTPTSGGSYTQGTSIAPRGLITSFASNLAESAAFGVDFKIRNSSGTEVWTDTKSITLVAGEAGKALDFNPVTLGWAPGTYTAICSTRLALDCRLPNNKYSSTFTIVAAPAVDVTTPNGGETWIAALSYNITWTSANSNTDSIVWSADNGATWSFVGKQTTPIAHCFAWTVPGDYGTRNLIKVFAIGPGSNVSDQSSGTFSIVPQVAFWNRLPDALVDSKHKNVKDGGALAYGKEAADRNDTGYVYAFKGNNTREFFRYNTLSSAWVARDSIPAAGHASKKTAEKRGAALVVGTDGRVYGTKGGNTYEFWRYDPGKSAGQHWTQLSDVPPGGRGLKEGTGLAAVGGAGSDYIYLLKGSGTYEFYRYNIRSNAWETMANAPRGNSGKWFKYGSSITGDANDTVWGLKGSYNEFFAYSISNRNWVMLETMPRIAPPGTKKTKVKEGSQIAYADRVVYALKGGNTNEFWAYLCDLHRWQHSTDMTAGVRKVKGGGALVYAGSIQSLCAFRGNNTLEFWSYGPINSGGLMLSDCPLPKDEQGQTAAITPQFSLRVAPNPFSSRTGISYTLPRAGNVSLGLYDITGKLVTTLARGCVLAGSHTARLNANKLARGIYLLKYENEGGTMTSKLVIE